MSAIVMVRSSEERRARNDQPYASLVLNLGREGDFGDVSAKIWGASLQDRSRPFPKAGDVLLVQYKAEEYNGRAQWIIHDWSHLEGEKRVEAMERFTPPCRIDGPFYRGRLDELIERTLAERLSGLVVRQIFDRAGFRESFYMAPAARSNHQHYPGGLLEHTVNVTTLALTMADAYATPDRGGLTFNQCPMPIDREVLIAAGLLHDIGKLETYCFEPLSEYTEINTWQGHLALSYATVYHEALELLRDPRHDKSRDELQKLLHCILAHHGAIEFGSPVAPACAEAFLLSQADMTDARLAEIAEVGMSEIGRNPKTRWVRNPLHFPAGMFVGDWPRKS